MYIILITCRFVLIHFTYLEFVNFLISHVAFISANGNECTNTKRSDLLLCACDTLVKYIRGTFSDGAGVGGIGILDLLAPDATKCR